MAIVHKVWRAAAIEVPYAERTAGGRTWGYLLRPVNEKRLVTLHMLKLPGVEL